MPSLEVLAAQYPILSCLSSWVSTLDLYHLSLTSRHFHDHILASKPVFAHLTRTSLCEGRGLKARQNFEGSYKLRVGTRFHPETPCPADEPIEVRLWALQCDDAGALPCRKCGVNVCEECRCYARETRGRPYDARPPHINGANQNVNIFCLCDACDSKLEQQLRGQFLSELCDCDAPKRWICSKCTQGEAKETRELYTKHTFSEIDDYERWEDLCEVTKDMMDHQFRIAFLCHCGDYVPKEARPRCTWCKRRHQPEREWRTQLREIMESGPAFKDPCYPVFNGDPYSLNRCTPYPKLAYEGPVWQGGR